MTGCWRKIGKNLGIHVRVDYEGVPLGFGQDLANDLKRIQSRASANEPAACRGRRIRFGEGKRPIDDCTNGLRVEIAH